MKVLSLFDGISCGMVAFEKAGISIERYVAYEIETKAIDISKKNYPEIEHRGDVTTEDFTKYKGFDILIGGSPCQSLSITRAEIRTNLSGKSKLFFEYARALEEVNPKYFLFENVASMNQESKRIISETLGCEPILINSNCFVAQDRARLYWTNIPVETDGLGECNICLQDIMEENVSESFFYNYPLIGIDMSKQVCATMDFKINEMHKRIFNPKFKVHTLTACAGGNLQKKVLVNGRARKLTPVEYERLQGLPDNYTEGVANTHRYNALGNGWTVDVIAYIFSYLKRAEKIDGKYLDVLEKHNWAVCGYTGDGRVELEKFSPAGEDFIICVEVGNLPAEVREYSAGFDIDEHIEMWIEARRNGTRGVPSIRELVKDAEDIYKMLQELATALSRAEELSKCVT